MILILFSLLLCIFTQDNIRTKSYQLQTFTSQQQQLDFNSYQSPYQINVKRLSSTTPNQPNHCKAHPRRLGFNKDSQVFRLDTSMSTLTYDESIYMSITSLNDSQEIMEFQNLKEQFFVVTNNNKVYFLRQIKSDNRLETKASINLPEEVKEFVTSKQFFILVIDNAPFLIFPHLAVLCSELGCKSVEGWKPLQHITHASFMKIKDRRFILLSQNELGISIYQLTKDNKLENHENYGKNFFNTTSGEVSMFDIAADPEGNNKVYVLDYNSGLYQIGFNESYPTVFTSFLKILDQRSCFSMDLKTSNYIVMNCRVGKSDFLLQVYRDTTTGNYISQRPVFKYQTIFDVILTDKFYASRGYSGLKFYWVNPNYPYPTQFKKAGELFIHNAIQIRHKNNQSQDYLFYATPNSIHRISITQKSSFATCLSEVPTQQSYLIQYKIPCQNQPESTCTIKQNIKFEVWKHSGISVMKTLVPTLLSFVGAIAIVILLIMLYKKYKKEEDEVSLRFATSTHEFELESAR